MTLSYTLLIHNMHPHQWNTHCMLWWRAIRWTVRDNNVAHAHKGGVDTPASWIRRLMSPLPESAAGTFHRRQLWARSEDVRSLEIPKPPPLAPRPSFWLWVWIQFTPSILSWALFAGMSKERKRIRFGMHQIPNLSWERDRIWHAPLLPRYLPPAFTLSPIPVWGMAYPASLPTTFLALMELLDSSGMCMEPPAAP